MAQKSGGITSANEPTDKRRARCSSLSGTWVLLLPVGIVLAGCTRSATDATEAAVRYPTGIEYHQAASRLLVSSYDDGAVEEIALDGEGPHRHRLVLAGHQDGIQRALRIKLDAMRDRLWLLDRGHVYIYQVATWRFVRQVALPGWTLALDNCLPDMAVDRSGAAFISSNVVPMLWRIDPDTFEVTVYVIELDAGQDKDSGISAITFSTDDGTLFAASASIGYLWRIDTATRMAHKVQLTYPVKGACALMIQSDRRLTPRSQALPHSQALFVSGGFSNGLLRIDLSPDLERGYVMKILAGDAADVPIGMAFVGQILVLASSQLSRHPDYSGNGNPALPFRILPLFP